MTKQEIAKMNRIREFRGLPPMRSRDQLFEEVRAAQTYALSIRDPIRQEEVELSAFMAIFHPDVPGERVRDMLRDVRYKERRS